MSETLPSFTQRHFPTYSRWFSTPGFQAIWRNLTRTYKHVLVEADLPAPIKETIRVTVKKTRLWHREMRDVAAELVTHFQDGLDAGKTSEELIKSFGDARQAAKLIRKAKRRCRPLWWQAWWYTSRAFGLLVCWYLVVGVWQYFGSPSIKTDYLAIINKQADSFPAEQKAWPLYREALREIDLKHMGEWYVNLDFDLPASEILKQKEWPEIEKWLNGKQHAFSLINEGSKRPGLGFKVWNRDESFEFEDRKVLSELWTKEERKTEQADPSIKRIFDRNEDRSLISVLLPHINPIRQMTYILYLDTIRAVKQRDSVAALRNVETMYGLSKHCEENPFLVSELVGSAIQGIAFHTVQTILDESPELWNEVQLAELAHLIAGHKLDFKRSFYTEQYWFDDSLQRIYTDDGNGDGRLTKEGLSYLIETVGWLASWDSRKPNPTQEAQVVRSPALKPMILPTLNTVTASRKEIKEMADKALEYYANFLDKPLSQLPQEPPEFIKQMEAGSWKKNRYWIAGLLIPSYNSVLKVATRNYARRDGALIGIALELHHRKHGAWPQSLNELTPTYLPSLPVDRINGTPLCYKVVDDRPVVYSKGWDGFDDGGAPPLQNQTAVQEAKTDGKSIEKEFEYWMDYYVSPPGDKPSIALNEENGDWIIWTTLPEHRKRQAVEEPVEGKSTAE
jgi:hypothetical protein